MILSDGVVRHARIGVPAVSMSESPDVALYFAKLAANTDLDHPIVLVVDDAALRSNSYDLEPFEDPIWGPDECAWEKEIVSWVDFPIDYVIDLFLYH